MSETPENPAEGTFKPAPPQKAASMATYKRELRKEIRKRAVEPEINFLNITAMMDMMTIILVFLLKSMSATNASMPQSNDLLLAKSVLTTEASQEGVAVIVTKSKVLVDDQEICPVPAPPAISIEAKYKAGPNSLSIVPLANALSSWRERDKQVRAALQKTGPSEAIVIADAQTPYRIFLEVLNTLADNEFGRYHLMVLQGAPPK